MHTLWKPIVAIYGTMVLVLPVPAGAQTNRPAANWSTAPAVDGSLQDPFLNPKDQPGLPRVLLLGDSISIGYTIPVRQYLRGQAMVHRPPENCCFTGYALSQTTGGAPAKLQLWLGTNQWAVIHFNWGIWDTHGIDKKTGALIQVERGVAPDQMRCRTSLEQYRTNLTEIVAILRGTGARLIWASTTPLMYRTGARFEDIAKYNAVAAAVMQEHGIPIDDLYSLTLPETKTWQQGDGHFLPLGNQHLGEKVGKLIRETLTEIRKAEPAPKPPGRL